MRTNGGTFGLVLGALLLSACGSESPPLVAEPTTSPTSSTSAPPPATSPATSTPAPGEAPVVTLVDSGQEPRQELRLQLEKGDRQQATMTMSMDMEVTVNGKTTRVPPIPAMSMGMEAEVVDVAEDGTLEMSYGYTGVDVAGDSASSSEIEEQLDRVAGLKGTVRVTSRGEVLEAEMQTPSGLSKQIASMLASFEEQLRSLSVPFPEEAVGVGASWTVDTVSAINGIDTEAHYRYRVADMSADGVELEVSVQQTAPEQVADLPDLPKSVHAYVDSMDIEGSGTVVHDLGLLLPASMAMRSRGTIGMTMWDSSNSLQMLQRLDLRMGLDAG